MSGSFKRIMLITVFSICYSLTSFSQTNPKWDGAWSAADTAFIGKSSNNWRLTARTGFDGNTYKATKYYMSTKIPGFWEYLPTGYQTNTSKKYPLVLYFPGCGETNGGNVYLKPDGELLYRYGLGRLFFNENSFKNPGNPTNPWFNPYDSMSFPSLPTLLRNSGNYFSNVPLKTIGQVYPWGGPTEQVIVLCLAYNAAPQIPCDAVQEIYKEDIDAAIARAFELYRVDPARVYITGMSQGAKSSWFYPASSEANAKKIAATAPVGSVHAVGDIINGGAANIAAGGTRVLSIVNRYDLNTNGTGTNAFQINLQSQQAVNSIVPNRAILDTFYSQWQISPPHSPSSPATIHNGWERAYRTDTYESSFIDNTASTPQRYTVFEWFLTNKSGSAPVPCNAPTTPTTASITQNTATLGWSAGTGNTAYSLEYKKTADATWTVAVPNTTAVTYALTGLVPATSYDWRVKGICDGGTETSYLTTTFNTLGNCVVPTGLSSTDITVSSAQLSWTAATGAVSYDVEYKTTAAVSWTLAVAGTTGTAYNLSGLSEGTQYDWRVRANCGTDGSSSYVTAKFTTTGTVACTAPASLNATTITASSAQLSWGAAGGAVSYDIEYKTAAAQTWTLAVAGTTGTAYNLTGLAESTTYNWRVKTNCASAVSDYANGQFITIASTPVGNCPTPSGLKSGSITQTAAQLSWAWVGASNYTLEYKVVDSDTWIVASASIQGSSFGLYTLSAGTTYDWRLRSNCGANGSSVYVSAQFTTLPCNAPTGVAAGNIGNTSAQLSWVAAAGSSNYTVEYKAASATTWIVASASVWGTAYNLSGLQSGTLYDWRVRSNCGASGTSVYVAAQFTTTGGAPACNPPTGLSSGNITISSAQISWSVAANALTYDIEYKASSSSTWIVAGIAFGITTFDLVGLAEATTYDWRIRSVCSGIGTSGYSTAQFTTNSSAVVCNAPSGLLTGSITVSSAQLSWSAAANAVSYDVEYKTNASANWLSLTTGIQTTTASLNGLAAGTVYDWRVRTNCGGAGNSSYSVAQFTTTNNTPPTGTCTAPGSLRSGNVTISSAQFSWTWVGAASYTFEYKSAASDTWIVASTTIQAASYSLYNLLPGTTYDYRVRSNCGANGSSVYVSAQFTTLSCPSPANLNAGSVNNTSAQLSWSWAGGSGYTVEYKAASAVNWIVASASSAGTSYFLTGLTAGTTYDWRVRTNCGNGSSVYSTAQFTTTGALNTGNISQQGMLMETKGWKVFPVPARNYVNYSFTSSVAGKAYITVTDISGRTLRTEAIQVVGGFNNMRLDLNGILPGVYILRMTGKDHSQIGKIIIE